MIELAQIRRDADRLEIGVAVGIVNFTQWTLLALAPVIQVSTEHLNITCIANRVYEWTHVIYIHASLLHKCRK